MKRIASYQFKEILKEVRSLKSSGYMVTRRLEYYDNFEKRMGNLVYNLNFYEIISEDKGLGIENLVIDSKNSRDSFYELEDVLNDMYDDIYELYCES